MRLQHKPVKPPASGTGRGSAGSTEHLGQAGGRGRGRAWQGCVGFGPPLHLRLSILGPHLCYLGGLGIAAIWIPQGCSCGSRVGGAALGHSGPLRDKAGHPRACWEIDRVIHVLQMSKQRPRDSVPCSPLHSHYAVELSLWVSRLRSQQ